MIISLFLINSFYFLAPWKPNAVVLIKEDNNIENEGTAIMCSSQKQPSRRTLNKRCSENMQQIYRQTPIPEV